MLYFTAAGTTTFPSGLHHLCEYFRRWWLLLQPGWRDQQFDTHAIPSLVWLEGLDPPEILAPIGRTAAVPYRLYVPNNSGDLVTKSWAAGNTDASIAAHRTGKDVRPTRLVGGDAFKGGNTVRFLWRPSAPASETVGKFIADLTVAARCLDPPGLGRRYGCWPC